MPRSSSGIYLQPASDVNPPVNGTVIDPVAFAALITDIATELTNSVDRLGRGAMMAALQMVGHRITGLGSAIAQTDAASLGDVSDYLPAGAVMAFAMQTAPIGWLACDGSAVSRTAQAALFAAIGTTYGAGDGSTTFNLPDGRGRFIRGWDNGAGLDPSRAFGSAQADGIASHTHLQNPHAHGITDPSHLHLYTSPGGQAGNAGGSVQAASQTSATGSAVTGVTINNATAVNQSTGGAETTVKNLALLWCIRT